MFILDYFCLIPEQIVLKEEQFVYRFKRLYITDLVLAVLRLLREDLQAVVDSMEPVEP